MTRQIIFKHFYDLPGNQCSVSSVPCPGITGVSNVQYTDILLLRTVRQHFLLEAAGKVQIVYKALFAKLQRSPTLP